VIKALGEFTHGGVTPGFDIGQNALNGGPHFGVQFLGCRG
jgi:hypothetical protein